MDIEAEMRKLQEEARQKLAAESPAPSLPPNPSQPEKRAVADNPSLAENPSNLLNQASSALEAARAAKQIAEKVDPEILKGAAELAEKAKGWKSLSLGAKIGWGSAGLVTFLIAWNVFLAPLITALIAIAVLVLLVVGISKLMGFGKGKDEDKDETETDS